MTRIAQHSVVAFGYVVAQTAQLQAWKHFAVDLHGFMLTSASTDTSLIMRLDERTWRLRIDEGPEEATVALGWEVADLESLQVITDRLESLGFPVHEGSAELAAERDVSRLVWSVDPDGQRVEIFWAQRQTHEPFVSPTGARFVTGDQGLGHAMISVSDSEQFDRFYRDGLGMGVSDFVDVGPDPGTFLHCNPRHHSVAYTIHPYAPIGLGHIMVQVEELDTVGRAYDRVLAGEARLASTLGRHTNDEMVSYYVRSPSGWEIEYGFGGRTLDPATWRPGRWTATNYWGHNRSALRSNGQG